MRYVPLYEPRRRDGTYFEGGSHYRVEVPPSTPLAYVIKALALQGGGIIQLGPHVYETVGTINLVTGVSICGVPGATKIRKSTGDGPVVRVFTGARLEDCEVELSRTDGTTFSEDQEPSNAWENSVVHLCEPSLPGTLLTVDGSDNENGWQGTKFGPATIKGCTINTLLSDTRGIFAGGLFGVNGIQGGRTLTALTDDFMHVRVMDNTIIPIKAAGSRETQTCIYFAEGDYYGVCTGNICASSDQLGVLGRIKYDGATAPITKIAFGGDATSGAFAPVSSNVATYVATAY